ncbi:hypothetical protein [Gordonia hongkongensis]|uniref:Uncharacterized protein n=1 Tax=Gordonia hongkongensis TaxID=1701090 RepID=A0ABT6BUK9_9ACTN|nr:hypothetical protein [Gordonia hongkongensis]MDF6101744.1 hypothetical protein [Gordonia hongkongensis]
MVVAGLIVAVVAALVAAVSAWISWVQRQDAQRAAAEASADATRAIAAAQRVADAQEKIATGHEDDRRRAAESQAKLVQLHGSQSAGGRGRVRVTNSSNQPIFDAYIHSITTMVDGVETPLDWRPNPYMTPVIKTIDRVDGGRGRELFPFFEGDAIGKEWSPIVRFRDANKVQWEINLDNEVARVED